MGEASLFSPTVTAAERDGILIVTIDNPPVNATSANVRAGLDLALDHAEASASIIGLVITGAGRTFIGGADIKEFGRPPVDPTLPAVIARIEAFGKPVVAAINGAALGGGLEVALACHYRIGSQTALVGLPEVKLGLVPGAGGTQRLPRLIGIPAALDLIVAGRSVKAQQAKSLGILDEVAADNLVAVAADAAKALCGTSFRRTANLPVSAATRSEVETATAKLLAKTRGQRALQRPPASSHHPIVPLPMDWLMSGRRSSPSAIAGKLRRSGTSSLRSGRPRRSRGLMASQQGRCQRSGSAASA